MLMITNDDMSVAKKNYEQCMLVIHKNVPIIGNLRNIIFKGSNKYKLKIKYVHIPLSYLGK